MKLRRALRPHARRRRNALVAGCAARARSARRPSWSSAARGRIACSGRSGTWSECGSGSIAIVRRRLVVNFLAQVQRSADWRRCASCSRPGQVRSVVDRRYRARRDRRRTRLPGRGPPARQGRDRRRGRLARRSQCVEQPIVVVAVAHREANAVREDPDDETFAEERGADSVRRPPAARRGSSPATASGWSPISASAAAQRSRSATCSLTSGGPAASAASASAAEIPEIGCGACLRLSSAAVAASASA